MFPASAKAFALCASSPDSGRRWWSKWTATTVEELIKTNVPNGINYLTTAPIADNTDGDLKIVVLSSEPATKYNGYLYIWEN